MTYKRVFLIVLDSLGIGEAPDAKDYNDLGAHTIGHIAEKMNLHIPHMEALGYGNIEPIKNVKTTKHPQAFYTKIQEASHGKDTMTGHWEMMGMYITKPFQTFTDTGFPKALIDELEQKTGRKVIGNISASGTDIIRDLGEEHMKTGDLIVYTSADSVLQIAMHEGIIPIEEQYRICEIAREITMKPEWKVGRVIARPFIGNDKNSFKRTSNRHDYALKPHEKTALNFLSEAGYDVIALGKINDIFDGYGINRYSKTKSNEDGMKQITAIASENFTGLCFLNLVDFDALYGHRRDPIGYGKAIEEFDTQLPLLMKKLTENDLLILTADHGNDPIHHGTDHTREYVPMLAYSPRFKQGKELPILKTFADIGYTITDIFHCEKPKNGKSFLPLIGGEKK
ncbi:MAG: phosphopentomutase [Tenericutes bacterium GWC2_34_14]|nr:MAG: phosphopentomutase [Tenericutes bacterium GWA2_35_7]OHE29514.1 MAG: phosphopentomutase [Tenericutes bacterium GWC2_34_14]OHE34610.1 MAG: phosphopentomutase [Tenericutes bacterium GWE2_34_108]OHE35967.1 MAG: phosphopentomutase [Tenericutes bacterium GWF1_35_14]OHE38947.1 MAG: phosphopentomutase [Tenericutes bacterium GWF2_35_184]OHE42986.1 MAG: phosphopentomutase [Tenericutes bacterium RIFOXYA2_FULL_36_32]OHE46214.1 MAG: phosphopentomutase [Tenericutes bacterium RIFOXYB2_FULL_36_25]OH